MAVSFKVPESPATFLNSLTEFLGVDYNNPLDLDVRHSPKMENMILENGYLHKRHGLKIKRKIADKPIYGIWQYDVPSDDNFNEILIVHCGDKLYEVSTDFTVQTQVMSGLKEQDSYGMFMDDKLIILDGKRAIVYGKYGNTYGPQYMDQVAYIPTTTEALNPDGTNGTLIESANMMTQFRINTFISDGTSTVYHTDSNTISASIGDTTVWKLNASTGNWDLVDSGAYTVASNNVITFYQPIEATPITGAPNVKIQFKSTTSDLANRINKCRFCAPFGYRGNNKAMFYSGNPDVPNCDWHSEIGLGIVVDPTYIPDDTFTTIGSQPIIGYLRLSNGTLAILKNLTDSDCSIYYRTSNTYNGYYVYPLTKGTKNIGCLSNYTCVNMRNADLFLSEQGVCSAVTDEADSALERYADNKSYYINKKLLTESNLDKARALGINDYYYLFVNNKVYIGDTAKLTQTSDNTIYQYQWYLFNNIPARNVMRWNNDIVIGDNEGYIKMFGNDYIDEIRLIDTVGKNIFDGTFRQGSQSDITVGTKICNNTNILLKANQKYSFSTSLSDSYKFLVSLNTQQLPTENNNFYTSSWVTDGAITFIPSQDGYFGVVISTLGGSDAITPEDVSSFTFQLEKGDPTQYEPYTITPIPETQNVSCYFETIPLDFSNPIIAKTTRNFILNYIAPETTKFEFGYKTIDEEEVESEEIYKIVNESFDNDLSQYGYLPYGTKLVFDETVTYTNVGDDGIGGYLYGAQTDTVKTFFGFTAFDGVVTLGTFSIDITDSENPIITPLKEIYNSTDGYKMNSLIVKKKLDLLHLIQDELQCASPTIEGSGENAITIVDATLNDIPQTIRVKEKARKIMFLKIYVKSDKYACEFDRIYLEYRKAGKYRGE